MSTLIKYNIKNSFRERKNLVLLGLFFFFVIFYQYVVCMIENESLLVDIKKLEMSFGTYLQYFFIVIPTVSIVFFLLFSFDWFYKRKHNGFDEFVSSSKNMSAKHWLSSLIPLLWLTLAFFVTSVAVSLFYFLFIVVPVPFTVFLKTLIPFFFYCFVLPTIYCLLGMLIANVLKEFIYALAAIIFLIFFIFAGMEIRYYLNLGPVGSSILERIRELFYLSPTVINGITSDFGIPLEQYRWSCAFILGGLCLLWLIGKIVANRFTRRIFAIAALTVVVISLPTYFSQEMLSAVAKMLYIRFTL